MGKIMEVSLRRIEENDLEQIMYWRMDPDITKWMNTDPVLTLEGQKLWLQRICKDPTLEYWLIVVEGRPAGVINLAEIDLENREACWGYYVGEKSLRSFSLAISLELSLYDYVFSELELDRLYSETFSINSGVVKLHQLCGSNIDSILPGHVHKNGKDYDVTVASITKEKWKKQRTGKTYQSICFTMNKQNKLG